jgi:hypothetical protein
MRHRIRLFTVLALLAGVTLAVSFPLGAQPVHNGPLPGPNPLFPPDNWWNVDISGAPVDPNSSKYIGYIGANDGMHPDFGGDVDPDDPGNPEIYGMPYASVSDTQPLVPVFWTEDWDQNDEGYPGDPLGFPIPEQAKTNPRWIEGGHPGNADEDALGYLGDRHLLIVDRDNRILYELFRTFWNPVLNRWEAASGAIFSLDANDRRPEGWTSAEAAGLAIFPGLVRYDEAFANEPIRHAIRVTTHGVCGYVFPASHLANTGCNNAPPNTMAPPLGARLRLKNLVNPVIPGGATAAEAAAINRIAQAMKTYGLIVADTGSDMYFQGVYDTRWDNGVLNPAFDSLEAEDFEVIQVGWQPAAPAATGPHDFHTLPPCRLLDTRNAFGPRGGPALPPLWTDDQRPGVEDPGYTAPAMRVVRAAGECGVPAGARAVAANLTVVTPSGNGYVQVFRGNGTAGTASALSFKPGTTRAAQVIIPLSSGTPNSGTFGLSAANSSGHRVHAIVDVTGYFQ